MLSSCSEGETDELVTNTGHRSRPFRPSPLCVGAGSVVKAEPEKSGRAAPLSRRGPGPGPGPGSSRSLPCLPRPRSARTALWWAWQPYWRMEERPWRRRGHPHLFNWAETSVPPGGRQGRVPVCRREHVTG